MDSQPQITIYMAVSANGLIATNKHETPWSDEEWSLFIKEVSENDAIVVGQITWDIMVKNGDISFLPDKPMIVISPSRTATPRSNVYIVKSIKELLSLAQKKDYKKILVGGGAYTITQFINNRLCNQLVLDVEPILLENGIPLTKNLNKSYKLELISAKPYKTGGIQLRYKIQH